MRRLAKFFAAIAAAGALSVAAFGHANASPAVPTPRIAPAGSLACVGNWAGSTGVCFNMPQLPL